jgi:hypothetical protein
MATFGKTNAGGEFDGGNYNYLKVAKYTLSESASVSKLTVSVRNNTYAGHATCNMKGIIFDDDGAAAIPGTRFGVTNEVQVLIDAALAWVDLPFAADVSLTSGNWWIGLAIDSTATGLEFECVTVAAGNNRVVTNVYSSGVPDPWPSASNEDWNIGYCVYATYTTAPAGFTGLTVTRLLNG